MKLIPDAYSIAKELGATLHLARDEQNRVVLEYISTLHVGENRGVGSQIMKDIVLWADMQGEPIILYPSPEIPNSFEMTRLLHFYNKFGFIGDSLSMERKPNSNKGSL